MVLYLKPKYNGQLDKKAFRKRQRFILMNMDSHIYAANAKDAMLALGYVHAQDRLWQMELMTNRPGRLSEILEKWP
jgi:penicillin amidase